MVLLLLLVLDKLFLRVERTGLSVTGGVGTVGVSGSVGVVFSIVLEVRALNFGLFFAESLSVYSEGSRLKIVPLDSDVYTRTLSLSFSPVESVLILCRRLEVAEGSCDWSECRREERTGESQRSVKVSEVCGRVSVSGEGQDMVNRTACVQRTAVTQDCAVGCHTQTNRETVRYSVMFKWRLVSTVSAQS